MQSFVRIKRRFKFSGVGILFELTLFSLTCVHDGVFTLSVFTLSGISTVCLLFQTGWNTFVGALPGDIRTQWNTYYSLYGTGVPNAAVFISIVKIVFAFFVLGLHFPHIFTLDIVTDKYYEMNINCLRFNKVILIRHQMVDLRST